MSGRYRNTCNSTSILRALARLQEAEHVDEEGTALADQETALADEQTTPVDEEAGNTQTPNFRH